MSDEAVFNLIKKIEPHLMGQSMSVALSALTALTLTAIQNSGTDPQQICDYLLTEEKIPVTKITKN